MVLGRPGELPISFGLLQAPDVGERHELLDERETIYTPLLFSS